MGNKVYTKIGPPPSSILLNCITDIWSRKHGKLIEVRMGWDLYSTNHSKANPFDFDFPYSYVRGVGVDLNAALNALKREAAEIAEGLFL